VTGIIPELAQLNLTEIPLVHGFYSLGLVKKYCPNVEIVCLRMNRNDQWTDLDLDPERLYNVIQQHVTTGKTVFVIPFEEYIMEDSSYDFASVLNNFVDQPVYFITEMDQEQSLYWKFQKNVKCKILELPYILVNDAICYSKVKKSIPNLTVLDSEFNFLCMINRSEKSKYDLVQKIYDLGLHTYGLVTYRDLDAPLFVKNNFVYNPQGPLDPLALPTSNRQEAGQIYVDNILLSSNVINYFHIEQTYNIPLIINPESTVGIFPATEKSMWPALLGKMYLIYGHQHIMQWVSRFCSYGPKNFCDLSFDNVEGYDQSDHDFRLMQLLTKNKFLIQHAREIYKDHKDKLEINRNDFVTNLYDFFKNQIHLTC